MRRISISTQSNNTTEGKNHDFCIRLASKKKSPATTLESCSTFKLSWISWTRQATSLTCILELPISHIIAEQLEESSSVAAFEEEALNWFDSLYRSRGMVTRTYSRDLETFRFALNLANSAEFNGLCLWIKYTLTITSTPISFSHWLMLRFAGSTHKFGVGSTSSINVRSSRWSIVNSFLPFITFLIERQKRVLHRRWFIAVSLGRQTTESYMDIITRKHRWSAACWPVSFLIRTSR